ncbi:hypothetical protein HQO38_03205 [Rhodococcus fascians]|jgi:hypothetical protein|uniref:hypothetical protein n=1 Tax=Nocardiaceae TaxID=85025 RepID=UPI00050C1D36|nr:MULTISPECIES: hypothetical protein [Rhodococcus]MBY3791389.1 hypothetical protein [Rhodococcus fascians]MBY3824085.1 hypothetical protein [Rhodococcus fascians]MBY3834607.1 hypothetical protein [Rhodococcus fascians]MBY3863819.1 hypothetical protein [Rhodococcus fascians]MBY3883290.1 hypothetical protein [Rhodococcus fascians]
MMSTTRALTTKDRRWPWLGAVCAGISINAFGGAIGLASGAIDLSTEAHARLPLSNTALAGLALVLVVGVPMGLAAASALAGGGKTGPIAHTAGVLLAAWIVVQPLVIGETSWLQGMFGVLGVLVALRGWRITAYTNRLARRIA